MYLSCANPRLSSSNPVLKGMWPEGKLSITEVTKRPLTAATLFKNSMILLVENLASKVTKHWPHTHTKQMIYLGGQREANKQILKTSSLVREVDPRLRLSDTLSPSVGLLRNRTTSAASSPTMSSRLCCSRRSAAATRWSTSACWRMCECAVPDSLTDRRTLASCRGQCRDVIAFIRPFWDLRVHYSYILLKPLTYLERSFTVNF